MTKRRTILTGVSFDIETLDRLNVLMRKYRRSRSSMIRELVWRATIGEALTEQLMADPARHEAGEVAA
jgi:metal-responsive CopG/Arc/MetJ family transcriptional regulator